MKKTDMKHRLRIPILTFLILYSGWSLAQSPADANTYFETGDYQLAFEAYKSLLIKKPKDPLYNFRYAYSAYKLNNKTIAIEFFKKSTEKYPISNYYLGEMYFDAYAFEESAAAYSGYLSKPLLNDTLSRKVEKKHRQAVLGARFLNRVEDVVIVDSIVVDKSDFLKKIQVPLDLGTFIQRQLLTEKGAVDNIRYTTQRGDRSYFSELINGQTDLFTEIKLLDDPAEKTALGDLNTDFNENYPFLMLDGVTLYLASDGDASMGGYDIFVTRLNTSDNTFLKPENVGMPFNSPYNDYMMIIDEMHKVGWFASDRFLPEGKVAVYQFITNAEKKIIRTENPDSLINKAQIKNFTKKESILTMAAPEIESKKVSAVKKIFINDRTFYADATDFKSNIARNHYFQLEKLSEELDNSMTVLETLRKTYAETPDQSQLTEISKKIRTLEYRVKSLRPQIRKLNLEMRNEEIKSLQ